jgi:hypothetical protein
MTTLADSFLPFGSGDWLSTFIAWGVVGVVVLCLLVGVKRAEASGKEVLQHWGQLIDGLSYSSRDFYSALEAALTARSIPGIRFRLVSIREGAMLVSAERLYLRVSRNSEFVDVCAAPFGRGFFVSSWLIQRPSILLNTPILGGIVAYFSQPTYFKQDLAMCFHTAVHAAVLEVVDGITSSKGLRALSEAERRPVMRGFLES